MRNKVELSDLVEVIFEAMREDGAECRLCKVHKASSGSHASIYEIVIDSERKMTFSNKEAKLFYCPTHNFRTEDLNRELDILKKNPDKAFSGYSYFVKQELSDTCNQKCLRAFMEEENTIASLTVSKWIRYDLEDCDAEQLIPEILYEQILFWGNMNELSKVLISAEK